MRPDALLDAALRRLGPGTPLHGSLRNSGWYVGADIPPKKVAGAREGYAPFDEAAEVPVVLYDATIFGGAKRGLLLTTGALYWHITSAEDGFSDVRGRMPLGAIKHLALDGPRLALNAEVIGTVVEQDRKETRVLNAFFDELHAAEAGPEVGLAPALSPVGRLQPGSGPLREDPEAIFAAIRGLKALRDEGALTALEFEAKKQELLQRI